MSAHTHRELVEGCFRCELNKDELADMDDPSVYEDGPRLPATCPKCGEPCEQTILCGAAAAVCPCVGGPPYYGVLIMADTT